MSKQIRIISIVLALLLVASLSVLAEPAITNVGFTDMGSGLYNVTANIKDNGTATAGKQVTMLVYKAGETPSESNIIGVDQLSCDANGDVTFQLGTDSATPAGSYTVLVGGEDVNEAVAATSPLTLGTSGHKVSGTIPTVTYLDGVDDLNAAWAVSVKLGNTFLGNPLQTVTANNQTGAFEFTDVANGTYVVTIERDGFITRAVNVTVSDGDVLVGSKSLLAGDVYADYIIDASDTSLLFSVLGAQYGDANYDPKLDVYPDGIIDASDTSLAFANLGLDITAYNEDVDFGS